MEELKREEVAVNTATTSTVINMSGIPGLAVECSIDGDETVILCRDDLSHAGTDQTEENNSITTDDSPNPAVPTGDGFVSGKGFETFPAKSSSKKKKFQDKLHHQHYDGLYEYQEYYMEEEEEEEEGADLSWRLDPKKSLSDWTIHVQALVSPYRGDQSSKKTIDARLPKVWRPAVRTDVYHVHKSVLGVGPRRSGYFAQVFAQYEADKKKKEESVNRKQTHDSFFFKELLEESIDLVKHKAGLYAKSSVKASSSFMCDSATPITETSVEPLTVLELEGPAAEAFPALLDFVYSTRLSHSSSPASSPGRGGGASAHHYNSSNASNSMSMHALESSELDINTHTATGLHYLAVRLQIKPLKRLAEIFYKADVSIDNLMVYYTHARLFDDLQVLQHAAHVLAASILDMEEKMVIYFLNHLDAEFFLMVLNILAVQQEKEREPAFDLDEGFEDDATEDEKTRSIRLSLLVAIYCNLHRVELATALTMYEQLTDERLIPILDVKAAQVLLDIEQELKDDHTLTSLKRRCIDIVSYHWNTALLHKDTDSLNLPKLNGEALRHFSMLSLTRAKFQIDNANAAAQAACVDPESHTEAMVPSTSTAAAATATTTTTTTMAKLPPLTGPCPSPPPTLSPPPHHQGTDDELVGQIIVSTKVVMPRGTTTTTNNKNGSSEPPLPLSE